MSMVDFESIFKPVLSKGNPIREIGFEADKITETLGIPVVRLHLGNPSTAQFDQTKNAMIESISTRVSGYGPHPGSPDERGKLADFFNDAEGVPGHFEQQDAIFFPGATLITKSLFHIFAHKPGSTILLSSPGYPVYENQVLADGLCVRFYKFDSNGLVTFELLDEQISAVVAEGGEVRAIVLTYPHNPTGKALTDNEAQIVANAVNKVNEKYPNIIFYNDSVYSGTCSVQVGYNSFYPYLTDRTRQRVITGVSGAKLASLGGERIGGIATKNPVLRTLLTNAQSQMTAGVSVHSITGFLATTALLTGSWKAGAAAGTFRGIIAEFYQKRINLVASGLGVSVVPQVPQGGMYVYADFTNTLKGKPVPLELRNAVKSDTIESGRHLRDLLLSLHLIGYVPVATVNGEVFGESQDRITLRISCVEKSLVVLGYAINSFRAVLNLVGGVAGIEHAPFIPTMTEWTQALLLDEAK